MPATERPWHTLLILLAAPLAFTAIVTATWLAGGRAPLDTALADSLFAVLFPLGWAWLALAQLGKPYQRALAMPIPFAMHLFFSTQMRIGVPVLWTLPGHLAWLVLIAAGIRGDRGVARAATICGCGFAIVLHVTAAILSCAP